MSLSKSDSKGDSATTTTSDKGVYYFGYGPIVNPLVRKRRKLQTCDEQAAVLRDYRLTFNFGGVANVVPQRGYEVHGILMRFPSQSDWNKFQEYDAGYNDMDQVTVYPYESVSQYGRDDEDNCDPLPIMAYTMVMKDFDETKLDKPIENRPPERYLKLISSGMRHYHADEDYVQDEILSVPYIPSRKPEEYESIPQSTDPLPKISLEQYKKLCQRSNENDVYFVFGQKVIRLGPHDPENPGAVWIRERLKGQEEGTLIIHETIVEPDLPVAETIQELTPRHHAWVEDHMLDFMRQCSLSPIKVYQIVPSDELRKSAGPLKRLLCRIRSRSKRSGRNSALALSDNHSLTTSSEFIQQEIHSPSSPIESYTDDESEL